MILLAIVGGYFAWIALILAYRWLEAQVENHQRWVESREQERRRLVYKIVCGAGMFAVLLYWARKRAQIERVMLEESKWGTE